MTRRAWRLAAIALVAMLAPGAACAHAFLIKSSPARRASLTQSPSRVELWFSERIEPAYSTVSVWDTGNARVDREDVAVAAADPKLLTVSLQPLRPGAYTVRFRVLSVDGHVVESSFPFTVGAR